MDLEIRLSDILQPLIRNAEVFAQERDFQTSLCLTTSASRIFHQLRKLGVENADLHLTLARAYVKLATYLTIDELSKGRSEHSMLGDAYENQLADHIHNFSLDSESDMNFLDSPFQGRIEDVARVEGKIQHRFPGAKASTVESVVDWYRFMHTFKVYLDSFGRGRELSEEETQILRKHSDHQFLRQLGESRGNVLLEYARSTFS